MTAHLTLAATDRVDNPTVLPAQRTTSSELARVFDFDVAVVGLGHVGLPTAIAFHAAGMRVLGIDASPTRLDQVRSGAVDLGVADLARLSDAMATDRLQLDATTALLSDAAAIIICVPTDVAAHHVPDLTALEQACRAVVDHAVRGQTIIQTSTSYVGTTRELLGTPLRERGLEPGRDVFVGFSFQRVDSGHAGLAQERIPRVVGGLTAACTNRIQVVLAAYNDQLHVVSSPEAAEFTKIYENTFRAVNIAYANEMSTAAAALGLDVGEVIEAAATTPFGFVPFLPGPGVGGHNVPCDPRHLLWQMHSQRRPLPLISQAMGAIERRPFEVVARVVELLEAEGKTVRDAEIVVCGVAYKPDVEDVRESPALVIIEALLAGGAQVSYVDPLVSTIELPGGQTMSATKPTDGSRPDLVLFHTAHTGVDLDWVSPESVVLNATCRPVRSPAPQVGL